MSLDIRIALNTISDVVQNRPVPIREFDQIYMKVGDLVIQADFIARSFKNKDVIFIGDGDAISLSVMHLKHCGVFEVGPKSIHLIDFDERIVNSVNSFAKKFGLSDCVSAELYNVADPLPLELCNSRDAFYTNPPWGASNNGDSVLAFVERGLESLRENGMGAIVIADDENHSWSQNVLLNTQELLINNGFIISEMIPGLHNYHLDDNPELKSCTMLTRSVSVLTRDISLPLNDKRLSNFYGDNKPLKVKYIKQDNSCNNYKFEYWEGK